MVRSSALWTETGGVAEPLVQFVIDLVVLLHFLRRRKQGRQERLDVHRLGEAENGGRDEWRGQLRRRLSEQQDLVGLARVKTALDGRVEPLVQGSPARASEASSRFGVEHDRGREVGRDEGQVHVFFAGCNRGVLHPV